jgi:hypothetical protein
MIVDSSTPSIASSGPTASYAKADLRAAMLAMNPDGAGNLYWISAVDVARKACTLASQGLDAFPNMGPQGGEMAGTPAVVSSGVPAGSLYLVDASQIAADGGPVTARTSNKTDILMDSAPLMNSSTPTPATLVSMFTTNSTATLASAWFAAQRLRDDCVSVITDIDWGSAQ